MLACRIATSRVVLAAIALVLSACAAGSASKGAGSPRPEPEPTTYDAAAAMLDRGERELGGALADAAPAKKDKGSGAGALASPPEPVTVSTTQAGSPHRGGDAAAARDEEERKVEAPPSPCAVACRALASMQRAAAAVCRIVGEADERCTSARARVAASSARAESCRCGG